MILNKYFYDNVEFYYKFCNKPYNHKPDKGLEMDKTFDYQLFYVHLENVVSEIPELLQFLL